MSLCGCISHLVFTREEPGKKGAGQIPKRRGVQPGSAPDSGYPSAVRAEAQCAQQMSAEMGYYRGQVDAAEVLQVVTGLELDKRT